MQELHIKASDLNPEILFSPEKNSFIIKGISRPENVRDIYEPAVTWLTEYRDKLIPGNSPYTEDNPFIMQMDLEYFNSSSAKFLYDLVMITRSIKENGIPTAIAWTYDPGDPDIREAGEDLAILAEMDFIYIKRPE